MTIVRSCAILLPAAHRDDWRQEWEAELRHWHRRRAAGRAGEVELVRRAAGALPDAAWIRRQLTADADLVHDLRYAVRLVRRTPAASFVALMVFALGIGATTSVVTIADALMLRPLPLPQPDRVVMLWQSSPASATGRDDVSPGNVLDWIERSRSIEVMAAVEPWSLDYTASDRPEVLPGARVTREFFDVLRVEPLLGRTFTASEFQKNADPVVILSHALWQSRFGADRGIVGRAISLDQKPHTVVGVLPPLELRLLASQGAERAVWLPRAEEGYERQIRSAVGWWNAIGRLTDGVSIDAARAEMAGISAQLAREHPRTNTHVTAVVQPLRDHMAGSLRPVLPLLLAGVALVLVVACANIANLVFARGLARARELAMRRALGAARGRLIRQLLAETALLSIGGGLLGLVLARWAFGVIGRLRPADVAGLDYLALDVRSLLVAGAVSLLAALVAGVVPAIQLAAADRPGALRDGTSRATSRRRLTNVLVLSEIALAAVLLAGGGLLVRSFVLINRVHPGFAPERVQALQVFAWDRNQTADERRLFFQQVQERLRTVPGVTRVGAVLAMPFIEANINIEAPLTIAGRVPARDGEAPVAFANVVAGEYFPAMGIPLRRGRWFDDRDRPGAPTAFVIGEALARAYWPGQDPLGARVALEFAGTDIKGEIVGVVGDVRHDALDQPVRLELFMHHPQVPYGSMTFVVATRPGETVSAEALKEQIWAVDPQQALYRTAALDALIARTLVGRRFSVLVFASFAVVAMLLAAVGLYAVISFATEQRTREFGVRLALGARPADVSRLVIGEGLRLALAGLACGLIAALVLSRALASMLYGVTTTDPATYAAVAAVLITLACVSCYVPARRALRTDPITTLKND
jgi:predicted permease